MFVSLHTWVHDDVIKWKHFPHNWPFVREIHRSPVNSPHKGQWRGALMFPLIFVWINGWINNREAGDLRRHRAHCDVIVMMGFRGLFHWWVFTPNAVRWHAVFEYMLIRSLIKCTHASTVVLSWHCKTIIANIWSISMWKQNQFSTKIHTIVMANQITGHSSVCSTIYSA